MTEPIFIAAINLRAASEAARLLGLNPHPNTRSWRYLSQPYDLRGRAHLRVAIGYRAYDHPRSVEIGQTLEHLAKSGRIVEYIEVPER